MTRSAALIDPPPFTAPSSIFSFVDVSSVKLFDGVVRIRRVSSIESIMKFPLLRVVPLTVKI